MVPGNSFGNFAMEPGIDTLLELLTPITGSGGEPRDSVVRFLNTAFFWALILVIAWFGHRRPVHNQDRLLIIGFSIALFRDLFMASIPTIQRLGWISDTDLYVVLHPFEHMLFQVALWTIGGGFIFHLTKDRLLTSRFLWLSLGSTAVTYALTFIPFDWQIIADPAARFGPTWYDLAFHTVASFWLIVAAILMWKHSVGLLRKLALIPLVLFLLAELLRIPDILTGEMYAARYAPFRHVLYTLAVPAILLIYLRDQIIMNRRVREALEWRADRQDRFPTDVSQTVAANATIPGNPDNIRVADALAQLQNILRSDTFLTSRKSSAFLAYVAEKVMQGRSEEISAYDIGVDALGQHADFIASENAIVRVTALRLRELLNVYFSGEGRDSPIFIDMPRGSYRLRFHNAANRPT